MPITETVRALGSVFNVHNFAHNRVKTNFTLQMKGKENYIVVSFDKDMADYQRMRYLEDIKRKIVSSTALKKINTMIKKYWIQLN
jgi:hypothetical protein